MANNIKKQKLNVVSLLFWIYILIAILVLVIGLVLISINNKDKYEKYEDLTQLVGDNMFPEQDATKNNDYYLILYTRSTDDSEFSFSNSSKNSSELEPLIMRYANYYYKEKDSGIKEDSTYPLIDICASNLDLPSNRSCLTKIKSDAVYKVANFESLHVYHKIMPVLLHFSNGTIQSDYKFGYNAIATFLTTVMEKAETAKADTTTK